MQKMPLPMNGSHTAMKQRRTRTEHETTKVTQFPSKPHLKRKPNQTTYYPITIT